MTTADKIQRIGDLYVKFLKVRKSQRMRKRVYQEIARLTEEVCQDKKLLTNVKNKLQHNLVKYRDMLNGEERG